VSIYLDVLDVHFNDVNEGEWPHPGQFRATFDCSRQGGQNRNFRDCV